MISFEETHQILHEASLTIRLVTYIGEVAHSPEIPDDIKIDVIKQATNIPSEDAIELLTGVLVNARRFQSE